MWKKLALVILVLTISACATYRADVEKSRKRYYIVKESDNINSIAFAFEITTSQLQLANPWLKSSAIKPGQRLIIPGNVFDDTTVMPGQSGGFVWPLDTVDVSSRFGYRGRRKHNGIDLRAPSGTAIVASAAGKVVFSGRRNGYGLMVVIDHGGGIKTVYAHNQRNIVQIGERVDQGQVIARVGRSGNATGYHVHFEFRKQGKAVNPVPYLDAG